MEGERERSNMSTVLRDLLLDGMGEGSADSTGWLARPWGETPLELALELQWARGMDKEKGKKEKEDTKFGSLSSHVR